MSPARKNVDVSTYSGRFAARLRMLREKAGLTVDEVVARVDSYNKSDRKSPQASTYYGWEKDSTPHFDLLPAIAKALKISVRDLMPDK